MSYYREHLVKHSMKVRRCVGCDNFATVGIGDPYWSCFSTYPDAGYFAMCVPCHAHWESCDACQDNGKDDLRCIYECRMEKESG